MYRKEPPKHFERKPWTDQFRWWSSIGKVRAEVLAAQLQELR